MTNFSSGGCGDCSSFPIKNTKEKNAPDHSTNETAIYIK